MVNQQSHVFWRKILAFIIYTAVFYIERLLIFSIKITHYTLSSQSFFVNPLQVHIQEIINPAYFQYHYNSHDGAWIVYDGQKITELKTPHIDKITSIISASVHVRAAVVELQRSIACPASAYYGGVNKNFIVEGRDCGTVVFPDAQYKFFLTAAQQVRALRWQQDQQHAGKEIPLESCIAAIVDRDL